MRREHTIEMLARSGFCRLGQGICPRWEIVQNFVTWRILLRHWEAFFEHDGELAFDGVPLTHRTFPLG